MPVSAGLHYSFSHNPDKKRSSPVILIHGAGQNHLSWPPDIRRIPDEQILAVDLPGHGRSKGLGRNSIPAYAESLVAFLDELEIEKAVVVGHSMGGGIALQFTLDYPDRVSGLGLVASGARLPVSKSLMEGLSLPATRSQAHKLIIEWSYGPLSGDEIKQLAARNLVETRPAVLSGDLDACDSFNVDDRLAEIRVPTLVICGSEDKMTPLHFSTKLSTNIPGAAMQIIESAGHMVMVEQPARVAGILSVFFRSLR
ncbi:alpha/beta fold hydrolase [Chloroflexota bacterium]